MQILLVEDDKALSSALLKALSTEGHVVNGVDTGEAALYVINTDPPDIVVLDLGLPDMDGISVLRRIRLKHVDLPVLLLTARSSLDDKVIGLDSGADDYLAKPFEMTELFARIRVLARRLTTTGSTEIKVGNISLDSHNFSIMMDGSELDLSRKEFMLLKTLMENAGRILSRDTLKNRLYNWDEEVGSNALEVHIHHLRKKLGTDFIQTIRGIGYRVNRR